MNKACRLCGSLHTTSLFTAGDIHGRYRQSEERFSVYSCQDCRVVFVDVDVNSGYYGKYYKENYYSQENGSFLARTLFRFVKRQSFLRRLRIIKKYQKKFGAASNRFLEVGCGQGDFLAFLPSYFEKCGVEVNQEACRFLEARQNNIRLHCGTIEDLSDKCRGQVFDVIGLWSVFEHMARPNEFLDSAKQLLAPGGFIILDIPNSRSLGFLWTKAHWFHLDAPRHLFLYSREALNSLLLKKGLRVYACLGNPMEYFQDLFFSVYENLKLPCPWLNVLFGILLFPVFVVFRTLVSLIFPAKAEVNTYIIGKSVCE